MPFQEVFEHTEVAACLSPGLQALEQYATLIVREDTRALEGSVDIDACLRERYPQQHRWDYAFGYRARLYYVEVHHVSDSEVRVVIAKYQWLKDWQNSQPNPAALKLNSSYHWLSSGKGTLTKNSRYVRSLISAGLDYPPRELRIG